jgi:hypothetical protein
MEGLNGTKAASRAAKGVRDAARRYPKKVGRECHHIFPQYLGGAKKGATVSVPAAYHQAITNAFRKELSYGQGLRPDTAEATRIMKKVYSKLPLDPSWKLCK